ncbi:hypothetical protein [Bradyrhizobium sp. CCGUVB23]|uniref:hypothetical protein n=1 Tax=Bradyrhizobium sp. CCGUVB23 TaxID=2949630 RepID=UPI0020B335B1|nr:hypothetical protein [Bradyrhizobium sp. CCGUVB23]MCP3467842.1 hypothetical protein [Bradyrhizobium sp. CCGUVB23]
MNDPKSGEGDQCDRRTLLPNRAGGLGPDAAKEESYRCSLLPRKEIPARGRKKPISSIAERSANDDIPFRIQWIGLAMERANFEPFGERLAPARDDRPQSRASKYLLWTGTGLFWSLVGAIVLARAAFFEPGVFDGFSRVASLAKGLIF